MDGIKNLRDIHIDTQVIQQSSVQDVDRETTIFTNFINIPNIFTNLTTSIASSVEKF